MKYAFVLCALLNAISDSNELSAAYKENDAAFQ